MSKTQERILAVATELFAAKGYDGTSVRAICAAADANLNAVSYHFGGKHGLYNTVIRGIGNKRLASAKRILSSPSRTGEEMQTRLVLFAEETLAAWLEEPSLLIILFLELRQGFPNCDAEALASLTEQSQVLMDFLAAGVEAGLLRDGVDVAILAGGLLERLNNQVVFVDTVHASFGTSIKDPDYRRHWVGQTIDVFLHGAIQN